MYIHTNNTNIKSIQYLGDLNFNKHNLHKKV